MSRTCLWRDLNKMAPRLLRFLDASMKCEYFSLASAMVITTAACSTMSTIPLTVILLHISQGIVYALWLESFSDI